MPVSSRLVGDLRGNLAVLLVTLIPALAAVGAGFDYSRVLRVRSELADALAAGVQAVRADARVSDEQALAIVRHCVDSHMSPADATWRVDAVSQDADGRITGYASARVQTTIARIVGIDEVPISVKSQAIRPAGEG